MLFYSPLFLFAFLPLCLAAFALARGRARNAVLLLASLLFYAWGEPRFVFIAVASAGLDYLICRQIDRRRGEQAARRWLTLGIVLNLGLLAYFKYVDFFLASANDLLARLGAAPMPLLQIALPIGVSFVVFEKITYLVDVYRGAGKPARSFASYLLYVLLFPKLLAGPIVKYKDIDAQLRAHPSRMDDLVEGMRRFLLGLAKKVLLADSVGEIANLAFGLPPGQVGFANAWLGALCFTLQIYLDFSAYSDMAIGLARMFGFRLHENFNQPYLATSFTDFWRRWHISLSTWIRDYLYLPLGGNQVGPLRRHANLWLCFLLSGLWHGANWTFVIWGAYHGLFLTLDKLGWLQVAKRLPVVVNVAITFLLAVIGWVIFRAQSLDHIGTMLGSMLNPTRGGAYLDTPPYVWLAVVVGLAISFVPRQAVLPLITRWRLVADWALLALAVWAIGKSVTVTFQPFLYFRF
jgi:alginate O-acetyltransferase complex protein AlgI